MRQPKRGKPAPKVLQQLVDDFNRANPIGTRLRIWPGRMGEGDGELVQVVAPGAYVLGGHSAVVQVSGGHGCVALTHALPA